ncbi:hypothetical protein [uncultured Robinsoniella sp.]|uniref:hypothetical protein n=1 Tax=uncultured Robinsoniella sp. TaxID=904190 RepID=UPI00374E20D9
MRLEYLIKCRSVWVKIPIINKIIRTMILKNGLDLPNSVILNTGVMFLHNSLGTVIHPNTIIGRNVKIYQNVTIGRADVYCQYDNSLMKKIVIKDGAILCAGAKILCKSETLVIGENSIIAANAVLLNSVGSNEIWGGIPAKFLKNI